MKKSPETLLNADHIEISQSSISTVDHTNIAPIRVVKKKVRGIVGDLGEWFKNAFIGGSLKGHEKMEKEAYEEALGEMKQQAAQMGANSIFGFKAESLSTSYLGEVEIVLTGQAIVKHNIDEPENFSRVTGNVRKQTLTALDEKPKRSRSRNQSPQNQVLEEAAEAAMDLADAA